MALKAPRVDAAVRYACAVTADCRIVRPPADPFAVAALAGIRLLPLSLIHDHPLFVPYDIGSALRMTSAVTLSYPTFCIVYRDEGIEPNRLRYALFRELGHIFLNHYRDFPEKMGFRRPSDPVLAAEADAFARNLLAPVPLVDIIRYNRPGQARASLFGLSRSGWMRRLDAIDQDRACMDDDMANTLILLYHDFLVERTCASCGLTFLDDTQTDRCPRCGAPHPDWTLAPLSPPET